SFDLRVELCLRHTGKSGGGVPGGGWRCRCARSGCVVLNSGHFWLLSGFGFPSRNGLRVVTVLTEIKMLKLGEIATVAELDTLQSLHLRHRGTENRTGFHVLDFPAILEGHSPVNLNAPAGVISLFHGVIGFRMY